MKISGFKSTDYQMRLFDEPLGGHGHVRTLIGGWTEQLTLCAFGGRQHKTDSTCDYCPDISVGQVYLECKAMGRTKQTFVYEGRLYKDWAFSLNHTLFYCIWHHRTMTTKCEYVSELYQAFFDSLYSVFIVPFWRFYTICRQRPLEKLNSAYGRGSVYSAYGAGWRVNMTSLKEFEIVL